ncbi:antichymotrypsin-2 [Plutella xylostella]|uniref:antichymotrypsin-2 n=1 Tax=Plutella xylostella TaxID=51655 RepID=UPI0020322DA0|nr:antichymotrypsin-2 [Plutella xylostella]
MKTMIFNRIAILLLVLVYLSEEVVGSDDRSVNIVDRTLVPTTPNVNTKGLTRSSGSDEVNGKGSIRRDLALMAALESPEENLVISPVSVVALLSQFLLGATGKTETELVQAVGMDKTQLSRDLKPLLAVLNQKVENMTIHSVTKLFVDQSIKLLETFESKNKLFLDNSVKKIEFSKSVESAKVINDWVSEETNDKIKNMVTPKEVANAVMIGLNAIYFKGVWQTKFNDARPGQFTTNNGVATVPMMSVTDFFEYTNSTDLDAQMIRIPYQGNVSSMVIILPSGKKDLPSLLRKLRQSPELLNKNLEALRKDLYPSNYKQLDLTMPKFKIENEINLKPLCKKLGLEAIFESDTGLSEMSASPLSANAIKQKAFLSVTETGTEATAATEIDGVSSSAPSPFEMNVDHPFCYIIQTQNEIIFGGIVNSP